MTLVADGGSTKCDWVLLDEEGKIVFKSRTQGLNPSILTTHELHKRLARSEEIAHVNNEVERVYFYGAGCGTKKNQIRLKRFFEKYFRRAKCEVNEDILAACLSVTKEPGIVCVLGTGSNSCYFDGEKAIVPAPSLGYLIMDEASGNHFGKQLLRDYFYNNMPQDLANDFSLEFDLDPDVIKDNLYKKENPNTYLGNFANFIFSYNPIPPYFKEVLRQGLEEFIDYWVSPFEEAQHVPIHFVGTISHFSKDIIADILEQRGMTLGDVERRPINGLVKYFQQKIKLEEV